MEKIRFTIKTTSIITTNFPVIDYCDYYSIETTRNETIDAITATLFGGVKWLDKLFSPLYKFVAWLGLNAMKKEPYGENPYFPIGILEVLNYINVGKISQLILQRR